MNNQTPFLLTIVFGLAAVSLTAQTEQPSFFDQIHTEDLLKIELTLPIDSVLAKKRTNDYLPAVLEYEDAKGDDHRWEIKVRSRGRFRRARCEFPPLRLEFDKDDLRARDLVPFDSYKLVTHCLEGAEGKENVLREYLIYRLYQEICPQNSIRPQIVRVKYSDSESKRRIVQYGIILEDEKEVAHRLESEECEECYSKPAEEFNRELARRHALFQYMVGNHDWAINTLRNVMVLHPRDETKALIIPYDFDFATLVAASYALQSIPIDQSACGGRIFMGFEKSLSELQPTIEYFQSRKKAIRNFVRKFRLLNNDSRVAILRYLEQFYDCTEAGNMFFLDKSQY